MLRLLRTGIPGEPQQPQPPAGLRNRGRGHIFAALQVIILAGRIRERWRNRHGRRRLAYCRQSVFLAVLSAAFFFASSAAFFIFGGLSERLVRLAHTMTETGMIEPDDVALIKGPLSALPLRELVEKVLANQGTFHESLNLAALWKLPVIFVIEDNSWAISVPKDKSTSLSRNSERAKAYGIPGVYVDGKDVVAVYEVAKEAVDRARNGEGPSLIEIKVYRLRGHFEGDAQIYRSKEDLEEAMNNDPVKYLENNYLIEI